MAKLSASQFAQFVRLYCYESPAGYLFGARGEYCGKLTKSHWLITQYSGSQKTQALKWLANRKRVFDCWGLAEGYVNQETGSNIDIRAKDGYASWCDPKGSGKIPVARRVPGAAVFMGSTASAINHVGFLIQPVVSGNPDGDWYVGEARGVMYGCVVTKLSARSWTHWGWMTKHFDYTQTAPAPQPEVQAGDGDDSAMGDALRNPYTAPTRILKYKAGATMMRGQDVGWAQWELVQDGIKVDIDGDYGPKTAKAVKRFQAAHGCVADGEAGPLTIAAMLAEVGQCAHSDDAPAAGDDSAVDATIPTPVTGLDTREDQPDISYYDGKPDYSKVTVKHLWIREGDSLRKRDPEFERNVREAVKHGILWSGYLFFRSGMAANARKEVEAFVKRIRATGETPLSLVLDVEVASCTVSAVKAAHAHLRSLVGPDMSIGIYIGHHLYTKFKAAIALFDYIWVPRYNGWKTQPAHKYHIWQGGFGSFAGIRGGKKEVDCNRVLGGHTWADVFKRRAT